jgi:acyl carrier protein
MTDEPVGPVDERSVKVRGFRIQPGDIEAVLRDQAGVTDCAVIVRKDGEHRQLVAYVSGDVEPRALRSALANRLPDYMIPHLIVVLDAIPRAAGGVLDETALSKLGNEANIPRNETEDAVARIWAEVLGVKHVGMQDTFFELGGHSLMATRLAMRITEVLGIEIPLRLFIDESLTVADVAKVIHKLRSRGHLESEAARLGEPEEDVYEGWLRAAVQPYHTDASRLVVVADLDAVSPALVAKLLGALDRVHRAWGGGGLELESVEVGNAADAGVCA